MNQKISIEGHAIVSKNGMIADYNGDMPKCLQNSQDFEIFQNSLDEAALVVLGSKGHLKHENHKKRRRLVVTSKVNRFRTIDEVTHWNPLGASFEDVLSALNISEGVIAITGGNRVFDFFLQKGYDSFLLTEVSETLYNGIPCFSEGLPRTVLIGKGLSILAQTPLENDALSTLWVK